MAANSALHSLSDHITETLQILKNEHKLLMFIIRNKRNYQRGRIRFRHFVQVSRKHKALMKKWQTFSESMQKIVSQQWLSISNEESMISKMDDLGRDSKQFTDTVMICLWSFAEDYLVTEHEVNFCYLSIGILSRLYSVFRTRLHYMAMARKELFLSVHPDADHGGYLTIYWNDFSDFKWPHSVQQCICSLTTNAVSSKGKRKKSKDGAMRYNQFDSVIDSNSKEMDHFIKQIHSRFVEPSSVIEEVESNLNRIESKVATMKTATTTTTKTKETKNVISRKRKLEEKKGSSMKRKKIKRASAEKLIEIKKEMERYGHRRKPRFKGFTINEVEEKTEKMDLKEIKAWKSNKDGKAKVRKGMQSTSLFGAPSIRINSTFDLIGSVGGNDSFTPYQKPLKKRIKGKGTKRSVKAKVTGKRVEKDEIDDIFGDIGF